MIALPIGDPASAPGKPDRYTSPSLDPSISGPRILGTHTGRLDIWGNAKQVSLPEIGRKEKKTHPGTGDESVKNGTREYGGGRRGNPSGKDGDRDEGRTYHEEIQRTCLCNHTPQLLTLAKAGRRNLALYLPQRSVRRPGMILP
jgi:hypothetical protein